MFRSHKRGVVQNVSTACNLRLLAKVARASALIGCSPLYFSQAAYTEKCCGKKYYSRN
jgi:hypothetical protein